MRATPTTAEKVLWNELRQKKLGVKFRQQHAIHTFIVDFYCVQHSLIIEIDGDIHDDQKEYDEFREESLKALGCKILRFKNEQVLSNLPTVLSAIQTTLSALPPEPP